jgi:6-phosphofructokinase 1
VSGILTLGGTILGSSNTANPYQYAVGKGKTAKPKDVSRRTIANIQGMGLDSLVCIGGDGTMIIADRLFRDGVPVIGVPKTIDNDLRGTDITFGFDSAVSIATEAIDRVHSTAQSHHRVMVIEVMGRNAGWIALYAGVAGGGDIILIPEMPYDIGLVAARVRQRTKTGQRFTIIVTAEGARPKGGEVSVQRIVKTSPEPRRLGGIGFQVAEDVESRTGIETRTVVLGHVQRGGPPTPFDRVLATRLGSKAVDLIVNRRYGAMVGVKGNTLVESSLAEAATGPRTVPPDEPLIEAARSVGTVFGV